MKTTKKRVAFYLRVSKASQSIENQRRELKAVARAHGWDVVNVFIDKGVSGAKGKDQRPGFAQVHQAVARRTVDLVAAWSVDRLGRSLRDLVLLLTELQAKGVDLYLHQQGLDTSTPAGKALFGMAGIFSEFELTLMRERIRAGLETAKAAGKKLGRPPLPLATELAIGRALASGAGIGSTARKFKVGTSAVQRIKALNDSKLSKKP